MRDRHSNPDNETYILSFDDNAATDAALTGGKGANLARLADARFTVPTGFCVTTAAYRTLIAASDVQRVIEALDESSDTDRISELSATLRERIRNTDFPSTVTCAIKESLEESEAETVAVRSSATAEDLPTVSFAGQHETFLGVTGQQAVLDRIRDCMASVFTERAVSYRSRNNVSHSDVAMAVVVQTMVDPAAAGVLFTADPVSGNRHIASVDANYGLGETVVSGEVTPDTARIDQRTGRIREYELGEKSYVLRTKGDEYEPTPVVTSLEQQESRVLSDTDIRRLVDTGQRVEALFGAPQDIEWALVDDAVVLLQSRPITSLFPLPSPMPTDDRRHIYFSMGHQQAMAEALPPLVVDWFREMVNRSVAQYRSQDTDDPFVVEAGHRVYIDLTPLLHTSITQRAIVRMVSVMSEPAARALTDCLEDRRESVTQDSLVDKVYRLSRTSSRICRLVVPLIMGFLPRFCRPFVCGPSDPEHIYAEIDIRGKRIADRFSQSLSEAERVRSAFEETNLGTIVTQIASQSMPPFLAGMAAGTVLEWLYPDAEDELEALSKGFDDEIATGINQRLGDLADAARCHPEVADALKDGASLSAVEQVDGGEEFVSAFDTFLDDVGHRASSELDLSRSRWKDDPAILLQTIQSTLLQSGPGDHREHLKQLKQNAEEAATALETRAGRGPLGFIKQPLVRRLIQIYRGGIQLREYHKHGAAHVFAAVHDGFSDAGDVLAAEGYLTRSDDVWYLRKAELLAALEDTDLCEVAIDERRQTHDRYDSQTAPSLLTSNGDTPIATAEPDSSTDTFVGTGVSSGVIEGPARIIHDPSEEALEKGEILIAPSTDVGWTPLFQNAVGLVMEVGGQMTHGALVAREYGIPAVVSVSNATTDIQTGDRIRIDGRRGTVERLDR